MRRYRCPTSPTSRHHRCGTDIILHAGYRGFLVVPLLWTDRIVGALVVPGVFPEAMIDLLQTFAAQSVLAIQNARLFEDVGARTRELANSLESLEPHRIGWFRQRSSRRSVS